MSYPGDITTGLVGWWKLDDGSGTSAADSIGTNTGTLLGATLPTWNGSGKIGTNSLNFGGVGYVNVGSAAPLDPIAVSMAAWVRPSSFPNAYNTIVSAASGTGYHQLLVKSTGKLACYVFGSLSVSYDGTGINTLSTGTWYHIVLTYDSVTGLNCYVNGILDGSAAANGTLVATAAATAIGTDLNTAGRQWNGDLDEVRIYNRVLTLADVTRLYNYT